MLVKLHSPGYIGVLESVSYVLHFWDMFDSMSHLVCWRSVYSMCGDRAHFYVS